MPKTNEGNEDLNDADRNQTPRNDVQTSGKLC